MKLHGNARSCLHSRLLMVRRVLEEGWTLAAAAEAAGVSVRTVSKWVARFRVEGADGLLDRSSAPAAVPHRTAEERVELIALLRRLRMTGAEIAETLAMPVSTVSVVLTRIGLGKLSRLEPPEPPNRYERRRPGELLHIDVKKLGRIKDGAGKRFGGGVRRHNAASGSAGSTSTSASTTRPGSPTSRCSRTRKPPPPPAFCAALSRTSAPTGSRSSE